MSVGPYGPGGVLVNSGGGGRGPQSLFKERPKIFHIISVVWIDEDGSEDNGGLLFQLQPVDNNTDIINVTCRS